MASPAKATVATVVHQASFPNLGDMLCVTKVHVVTVGLVRQQGMQAMVQVVRPNSVQLVAACRSGIGQT